MGELRACLLPVGALHALLGSGTADRERVLELVAVELSPARRPDPLGPIFARVPGAPVVRAEDPTPDDLDRLLAGDAVAPDRVRATWRLVEAVAAGTAASTTRTATGRPTGLASLGLALAESADLVVGSWTLAEARAVPSLAGWLDGAVDEVPPGSGAPDVVVFWESCSPG